MGRTRVYCAGVVLGASLVGAVWLYTYRASELVEYIGRDGRRFHASEYIQMQPWWSVYATVVLVLIGAGSSLWLLLPERRRLVDQFAASLGRST